MPFVLIILLRILFAASMVFIVGYVFGEFSKRPALVTITKIAVVLSIVLFIATNALSMRAGAWRGRHWHTQQECGWQQQDSLHSRQY